MFGTKTKEKTTNGFVTGQTDVSANSESCVIAEGTVIEGIFKSSEDVRLDGKIIGEVSCEKRLVMGKEGIVEGKITTLDAVVRGRVDGEIRVSGILHLQETAHIEGKIVARKLIMDEGAAYSGECNIGDQHFS